MNTTSKNFEWCLRSNGTYLDCPLYGNEKEDFIVGIHNPSVQDMEYFKFKVPHGHYDVFELNSMTGDEVPVTAEVICIKRILQNETIFIDDCDLHVEKEIHA